MKLPCFQDTEEKHLGGCKLQKDKNAFGKKNMKQIQIFYTSAIDLVLNKAKVLMIFMVVIK